MSLSPATALRLREFLDHLPCHQGDAVCCSSEAAGVFMAVFANYHPRWNPHSVVNYATIQACTTADVHLWQKHGPTNLGLGVHSAC